MKKLIYCAAALATALFAGSCQQELLDTPAGENTVTYTVEVPEAMTKAIGDGTNVNSLVYEVWKTDEAGERDLVEGKTGIRLYQKTIEFPMINGRRKANVTLNLVKNQNYTVLFWAQNAEAGAYNTSNLTSVTYKNTYGPENTQYFSNQEGYAAFYHAEFISETSPRSKRIELRRPFAQVNIATTNSTNDGDGAELYEIKMTSSKVTIKNVPTVFNVAGNISKATAKETGEQVTNGATPSTTTFVFDEAYLPNCTSAVDAVSTHNVANQPYEYAAMNYIFANGTVDVTYEINTVLKAIGGSTSTTAKVVNTVYSVPVEENYRTNIVGNLLTSTTEYEVVVDAEWANEGNEPPYLVELWDGESVSEPAFNDETNTYTITNGSELAWLAAAVNGTLTEQTQLKSGAPIAPNDFSGKTVVLSQDINLDNHDWTPIGTENNNFKGTFDGNSKTIMNLQIEEAEAKEGKAYIGLFGYTKDATIKNVTLKNVDVNIPCLDIDHSQGHIGALVGSLEGEALVQDVTVEGDIKIYATQDANGASRVAVVAGGNSYGDVTMKNVHVKANKGSYLKANNNTGALAGQLQGKMLFENCSSNIDVTVNKFFAGGLVGIAAGESKFENCHTSGNIAVVAGREGRHNDEYRVGGIAGGWADGATKVCTLVNCSYSGNVSGTNLDGSEAEPLDYMGYVGRGYTLSNCAGSKVIIDGTEFIQKYNDKYGIYTVIDPVATAEELVAALANGWDVKFLNDITIAATKGGYNKAGILQNKAQTIDGNGHTLTVTGAGATWDCAIYTNGGLIKNLTVAGAMRGIFTAGQSSDLHIDNVVFKNVIYTFNSDGKMPENPFGVYVSNSTVNGWTSHSNMHTEVVYTNCSFGEGSGYAFCRPYGPTSFVNCDFCEGYKIDALAEVAFVKCTINGEALTDIAELVTGNAQNAKNYTEVSTSEELVAALAAGKNVRFNNDITIAATKGGYNKAGILQNKAQTIDGNGYTLTVTGAGATWDCAIYTNGGVIKNLTVAGAMRGIFTAGQSSDLYIENVTFKNVIYTFNSDGKMPDNPFGVYVSNSNVNGWTSHSDMHTEVVYTNCSFGEGSGYKYCRPYGTTSFVGCTFCSGYTVDQSQTSGITFSDCTFEE